MNYEKKYKEALNWMKDVYPTLEGAAKEDAEHYFPELKESEDEKIREDIIWCLKHSGIKENSPINPHVTTIKRDAIAWLEKQGEPAKLSEEEQNKFAKGVLTSCALSFIDYLDAHKYEGKMCVSNGECEDIENAFHNAMWDRLHRYYCKYIEKQGEQKPTDKVEQKFEIGDVMRTLQEAADNITDGLPVVVSIDDTSYRCTNEIIDIKNQDNYEYPPINRRQKPTWSEEDEMIALSIKQVMTCASLLNIAPEKIDKIRTWLKSLKERVKLHPKQEWSESDEKMLGKCIDAASGYYSPEDKQSMKGWLSSLKERYTWKPSDEQMKALQYVYRNLNPPLSDKLGWNSLKTLELMYQDLKKLKG